MSSPRLPHVQRLIGLARSNGVDVRPTLLRVLVDQFVAEPVHPAAEVTRFGELVLHLLARADEADRATVSEKLAGHAQTPAAIARRLAADLPAVALPMLRHSPALSDDDLFLAVRSGDTDKALAVAGRQDIGLAALVALEDMRDPGVKAALAARVPPSRILHRGQIGDKPGDLGQAFLHGNAAQRETIIATLVLMPSRQADTPPADPAQSLELAALSRRQGALGEAVARAFGLDSDTARRIAEDESGEPLIVAARALDIGREATARVLLFAHQSVGTSVERIYGLTALYDVLPRAAALTIVRSWQATEGISAPAQRPAKHQPVLAQDASDRVGARQAASAAPRPAQRPAAVQPGVQRRPKNG